MPPKINIQIGIDENRFKTQELQNELDDKTKERNDMRLNNGRKLDEYMEDEMKNNVKLESNIQEVETIKEEAKKLESGVKGKKFSFRE